MEARLPRLRGRLPVRFGFPVSDLNMGTTNLYQQPSEIFIHRFNAPIKAQVIVIKATQNSTVIIINITLELPLLHRDLGLNNDLQASTLNGDGKNVRLQTHKVTRSLRSPIADGKMPTRDASFIVLSNKHPTPSKWENDSRIFN